MQKVFFILDILTPFYEDQINLLNSLNTNKFMIDSNGNVKAQGTLDISKNFKINNDKFIMDTSGNVSSKGNLDISGYLNANNN